MSNSVLSQFIPIVLILIFLMKTDYIVNFSHTIIGKLIAINIIIYYIILDKTIGLLSCLLIILYYQSDFVENLLNKSNWTTESFEQIQMNSEEPKNDITGPESNSSIDFLSYYPLTLLDKLGFMDYNNIPTPPDAIIEFRKRNCDGTILKYKGMSIKNENIDLIFPELTFKSENCNPCDKHCDFSIIESKLITEKNIIPVQSNEVFDK